MITSSPTEAAPRTPETLDLPDYIQTLRHAVDPFVAEHFSWRGTLRLHRNALGWDIFRAPVNIILSPVFVLTRIVAYLCNRLGLRRGGAWLARRRILLRTSVARRVETCIIADLLGLPVTAGKTAFDQTTLEHAVLAAPQFRETLRRCENADDARALSHRVLGAVSEYAGTRSAVSEITTVLFTLLTGAVVFQALTPGMISMAPGVAEAMAHTTAIANFPLGQTIGGAWYGVFATDTSPWLVVATLAVLVMLGSIFAAFVGILADPVQSRLGIHRRRLLRLIDTIEVELDGAGEKPFVAREHYYARAFDLWDAGASLLRVFRN
ncbi:MAG TPA: hypothetical protein ENH56_05300 [Roseobacter sp.]|jgi:hypothetical protein|uniref:Uncharacterized protein n=2 Tax=root TaxID=1 RepID=A8LT39_DINSH|nr:DUF6635 family protein [Dinoroseobacter shibae]ABV95406.1 conserved hypothetical protein [Dinoroseobacter shibae DFL 12 = DSM 16493]URF48779.1 hypothetical protein M8008_18850 [Dinoroseobacter shibae]HDZ80646.1 hypothetical protein [Roseobacter sp.]|tara:strand:+ start:1067 stop:2035 length:969 start_codon:yes stop_codon:yes gene_type:complete